MTRYLVGLGVVLGVAFASFLPFASTTAEAARNSGGTYALPAGNPVVSGTTISSTTHNNTMADVATELTNSLDRGGRGAMTAPLQHSSGTVNAPSVTFSADTNSGLYRVGSHDIAMSVNATKVMDWQAGAVALTGTLAVSGASTLTGDVTHSGKASTVGDTVVDSAGTNGGTTATPFLRFGGTSSTEGILSKRTATGNLNGLDLLTNGTSRISIANGGTVSIPGNVTLGGTTVISTGHFDSTQFSIGNGTTMSSSWGAIYNIDFPNTASGICSPSAQTLNGVTVGGQCNVSPDAELGGGSHLSISTYCAVTGSNAVTVYYCNNGSGSAINPSAGNFNVRVFQP